MNLITAHTHVDAVIVQAIKNSLSLFYLRALFQVFHCLLEASQYIKVCDLFFAQNLFLIEIISTSVLY